MSARKLMNDLNSKHIISTIAKNKLAKGGDIKE